MRILALLLGTVAWLPALVVAQDPALFEVRGRGIEDKKPYDGGGKLRFLDVSLDAQVVHYEKGAKIHLPLSIRYKVLQPAPILLTSRMGTEHWRLYDGESESMTALYTDEKIDLSSPGEQTARAAQGWFTDKYGPLPRPGLVSIRGHYYFLIDKPDGSWLDVTDAPPFFDQRDVVRELTFTLADLRRFTLSIPEVQSTWEAGGPLRVRVTVTDAEGSVFPVVNVPLAVSAGDWRSELKTQWAPLDAPTGWMEGKLPEPIPSQITVQGTVTLKTPQGLLQREVRTTFRKGVGRVQADQFQVAHQRYEQPRNPQGMVRETRAIWASTSDMDSPEKVETLVARSKQAGLNMIVPDIFVRNTFAARSDLMPLGGTQTDSFDPLDSLIKKAHAAGLEVHPWFCVTYRDQRFRDWFREKSGTEIGMIDKSGKTIALGADVHRPAYRDIVVNLMVGVARDYPVDGIHLDYIRTMGECYCDDCRKEFAARFQKPLVEATAEDWVAWQRQAIGDIVQRTAERVRKVRPGAKMSAAVFANMQGGAIQGQDPSGWAKQGWIDIVMPMDYQMQSIAVRANERQFLKALDDDNKLVTGLSLYMRGGETVTSRPPELLREQVELVRRMGIHGYCLFAFSHLSDQQLQLLQTELNAKPAVPYFR